MASSAAHTTANLPLFRNLIEEWEAVQPPARGFASPVDDDDDASNATTTTKREGKDVIVAFRTRPSLEDEAKTKFEEDAKLRYEDKMNGVITKADGDETKTDGNTAATTTEETPVVVDFCPGISVRSAEPGVFVAHVPGTKWTGPTLQHKFFESDLAFGPDVGNDEVYARTVKANDVINLVLGGGVGCVLAYGQTGSGKTYTMEAIEHLVARDVFPAAEALSARFITAQGDTESDATKEAPKNIFTFTVTFLEILGKSSSDLIETANQGQDEEGNLTRKEVAILENKLGEVRPRLIETAVSTPEELQRVIIRALSHRRVSATHRNAISSRSHAVLTIRVKNTLLPQADDGILHLVDLAGSERYEDSKAHDKKRMEESRENNKSLMNLKECVRAKAKSAIQEEGIVHIPFRANKLTLVLKPIFDIESRRMSKTIVIAHVSPHLQDSTHSVNTLSYASPFKMAPPKPRGPAPYDETDPRTWNNEQSVQWLHEQFKKRALQRLKHAHAEKEKRAKAIGKRVRPLDVNAPLQITVDPSKLCPPPMTARNLARFYTNEWIEACLTARADVNEDKYTAAYAQRTTEVKNDAVSVYGDFNYLLLTARTRTRNQVLKSRKIFSAEDAYGGSARDAEKKVEQEDALFATIDQEDMVVLQMLYQKELGEEMWKNTKKAREEGGDEATAKYETVLKFLETYRQEIDEVKRNKKSNDSVA